MGFQETVKSEGSLWSDYADQFPVRRRLIYLNHAAVAPLCRPAAEAMQWLAADAMEFFRLNADLFPKSATAQAELSRGYEALNDSSNAIASARRALAIDPGEPVAIEVVRRLSGPGR